MWWIDSMKNIDGENADSQNVLWVNSGDYDNHIH